MVISSCLGGSPGEGIGRLQDAIDHAGLAPLLFFGGHGFRDAVGECEQSVAWVERDGGLFVIGVG
jgi:hypothetical protein